MHEIHWQEKFNSTLMLADEVFKAGNKNLDLTSKQLYPMISVVGYALEEMFSRTLFVNDDSRDHLPAVLHEWLTYGFTLDGYEEWTPPQVMAAYAAYLIDDAALTLDDIPEPEKTTYMNGLEWRRDQVIEHCASNIIAALEACRFARKLLNETIQPDPRKLEEAIAKYKSDNAKHAANVGHSQKGGSREKREKICQIWATGKYKAKSDCAFKECGNIGMSYSTAIKALQNK